MDFDREMELWKIRHFHDQLRYAVTDCQMRRDIFVCSDLTADRWTSDRQGKSHSDYATHAERKPRLICRSVSTPEKVPFSLKIIVEK